MKPLHFAFVLSLILLVVSSCVQGEKTISVEESQLNGDETILQELVMDAGSLAKVLTDFQDGLLEPHNLIIKYSDLHPFHGGLEMTVDGSGRVQQKSLREEVGVPQDLSHAEMLQLVNLLIELEAWKQTIPEREPVPDESRAILHIQAGESESQIWEWYNDMAGNNRLIQIREMMKQLAWD